MPSRWPSTAAPSWLRSFNAIGAGQSGQFALPSFAAQLAAIARDEVAAVIQVGDLSPRRDFLHVDDAVAGYQVLVEHEDAAGVYNLASGEAFSIREALDRLRRISGVEASVEREEARVRPVDLPLLCGSTARASPLSAGAVSTTLDEALADLWHAVRDAPAVSRLRTLRA